MPQYTVPNHQTFSSESFRLALYFYHLRDSINLFFRVIHYLWLLSLLSFQEVPSMNLTVRSALAVDVPLVPLERDEDPTGLGFLPRLLFQGAGDLPNLNRETLLWEQRSTLRAIGFSQFLSLHDWLQTFHADIWPALKLDAPIMWPDAPRENVASPRGNYIQ